MGHQENHSRSVCLPWLNELNGGGGRYTRTDGFSGLRGFVKGGRIMHPSATLKIASRGI